MRIILIIDHLQKENKIRSITHLLQMIPILFKIAKKSRRTLLDIYHHLHASGLKVTAPRQRILELFHSGNDQHLTAEDVYRLLLSDREDIGMATVYRVLMQFVESGILVRNQFDNSPARFELNSGKHHDHMVCTQCGRVEEFVDPAIEQRQQAIAAMRGFAIADHTLSLYGICRNCAGA